MRLYLCAQTSHCVQRSLLHVSAQVAVLELALDQLGGDVVELLAQRRIAGVGPGQRGGVQPFADVLAIPVWRPGRLR